MNKEEIKEHLSEVYYYSQAYESTGGSQGSELIDTVIPIIEKLLKENIKNRICRNCKHLDTETILPYEIETPSYMIGKCNCVGTLYRLNVSKDFGCNNFEGTKYD